MTDATLSQPRRRTLGRKLLIALLVVVILLVALIALAPTLISMGIGKGAIVSAINRNLNGTAKVDKLSLGWFSSQKIHGLVITDAAGKPALDLDIEVPNGLLSLATGSAKPIVVKVDGSVEGDIRDDGSTSFAELIKTPPLPSKPTTAPSSTTSASSSTSAGGSLPSLDVKINKLNITIRDVKFSKTLSVHDLTGQIALAHGGDITANLKGVTKSNGADGSLDLNATIQKLLASNGRLTPAGATADVKLAVTRVPVLLTDRNETVESLTLDLISADLSKLVEAQTAADINIPSEQPGSLRGQFTIEKPFTPAGKPSITLDGISGTLTAQNIPTALLQLFLGETGIVLNRDLAKSINLDAAFSTGQTKDVKIKALAGQMQVDADAQIKDAAALDPKNISGTVRASNVPTALFKPFLKDTPIDPQRDLGPSLNVTANFQQQSDPPGAFNLLAEGSGLKLDAQGIVDAQSSTISQATAKIATTVHPAIVKHYGNIAASAPLKLVADASLPQPFSWKDLPKDFWLKLPVKGNLALTGPAMLELPAKEGEPSRAVAFDSLRAQIDTPGLLNSLQLIGDAGLAQSQIAFNESITRLFSADGKVAIDTIMPIGTVKVTGLPPSAIVAFAPAQADVINAAITGPLNATLVTSAEGTNLRAALDAAAPALALDADVVRFPDKLQVGLALNSSPSSALAAAVQQGGEKPIQLVSASQTAVNIEPFEIPGTLPDKLDLSKVRINAKVSGSELVLANVPSLVEPVALRNLSATVQMKSLDPLTAAVAYQTEVARPSGGSVAAASGTADIDQSTGRSFERAVAKLTSVSVPNLESLLGRKPGSLSDIVGAGGELDATVTPQSDGYSAAIVSNLTQLTGAFTATTGNDMLVLTADNPKLTITQASLQRLLTPAPTDGSQPASPQVIVEAPLTLTPTIKTFRIPLKMLNEEEQFDPAAFDLDVTLAASPLKLQHPSPNPQSPPLRTEMNNSVASLQCADLRNGINFNVQGDGLNSVSGTSNKVDVRGSVKQLVTSDSKFSTANPLIELTASANGIATAFVDVLAQMDGLLVAALGPQINANAKAVDFSPDSGTLDIDFQASNGWLKGRGNGRNQALYVPNTAPVKAELALSPALRDRLLQKIHPIFADVRTTKQPVRASVSADSVPLDGKINRLNADLEITVGEIELDSGSRLLFLLSMFNQKGRETIPGYIDPIKAKIRNGILTYDTFAMRIDKYTLNYTGQIDLNTQTVDLLTQVPLDALAKTFHEIEGYVEGVSVPMTTRGTFGNLKTEVDTSGLVKQAIPKAIEKGLGDLFKKIGK